ncbi:sce7725 family protein [Mycolicibacterium cosmeticum]|uniref:sce7725 family protein n=1 Tax=Mycolicibacterium cosmeticum TaxID=258533 RepID=UPI003204BF20
MYFPYFYGRQNELLALRDVATDLTDWSITPVIEPAMSNPRDLARCVQEVQSGLYLVINPTRGQFGSGVPQEWRQRIDAVLSDDDGVYPTHQVVSEADAAALPGFLQQFNGRRVGVVLRQPHIAAENLGALLDDRDAIVFVHTSASPRTYLQGLPARMCVEVAASFSEQARNADYGAAEWFTSGHLEFANDGRPGFSDFGPLPTTFSLSGGRAGAVAIHLVYKVENGSLWIHHFVSDTTDRDEGDPASKVAEAVVKIAAEVGGNPEKFVDTAGLRTFLANRVLDLGTSKRQQLVHHLASVADVLPSKRGDGSQATDLD